MEPIMKYRALSLLVALPCLQAHALGRLADVSVIDRNSGVTLPAYYHRGEYWVAGSPGARYSIAIRNQSGGRLLAVTAVDGVNVISGATAAWQQTGYVYFPGQQYEITGWRKSNEEVAAFVFSEAPDSYAARTGRAANVGVIGVALFRERPPVPSVMQRVAPMEDAAGSGFSAAQASARADAQADAQADAKAESSANANAPRAQPLEKKLGTGHGERENSHVSDTEFERQQDTPNEVIRIRYDSMANLIALGVIPRPRLAPGTPDAFPDSPNRFVPDPPGVR
jgi:hypothetical protein